MIWQHGTNGAQLSPFPLQGPRMTQSRPVSGASNKANPAGENALRLSQAIGQLLLEASEKRSLQAALPTHRMYFQTA